MQPSSAASPAVPICQRAAASPTRHSRADGGRLAQVLRGIGHRPAAERAAGRTDRRRCRPSPAGPRQAGTRSSSATTQRQGRPVVLPDVDLAGERGHQRRRRRHGARPRCSSTSRRSAACDAPRPARGRRPARPAARSKSSRARSRRCRSHGRRGPPGRPVGDRRRARRGLAPIAGMSSGARVSAAARRTARRIRGYVQQRQTLAWPGPPGSRRRRVGVRARAGRRCVMIMPGVQ